MACPKVDFHIHTIHLKCANETMTIPAILGRCRELGLEAVGITDHLNSLDKLDLHRRIRRDLQEAEDIPCKIFFGAELNFMEQDGDFAFNAEVKEDLGFQFAIGGIHSAYIEEFDLSRIVEIQHRHHLAVCRNPLVDVLVHPYWFSPREFERKGFPWFDSMRHVPESFARELGQAARETGTAIEINAEAILTNPHYGEKFTAEYFEFVSILAEEGASFSVGSDAHDAGQLEHISSAWEFFDRLGVGTDRLWRPSVAPFLSP